MLFSQLMTYTDTFLNLICHRGSLLQVLLAVRGGWMNPQQPSSSYTGNVVIAPREIGANCPGYLSRVLTTEVRCLHLCFLISTRDDFWPISALLLRAARSKETPLGRSPDPRRRALRASTQVQPGDRTRILGLVRSPPPSRDFLDFPNPNHFSLYCRWCLLLLPLSLLVAPALAVARRSCSSCYCRLLPLPLPQQARRDSSQQRIEITHIALAIADEVISLIRPCGDTFLPTTGTSNLSRYRGECVPREAKHELHRANINFALMNLEGRGDPATTAALDAGPVEVPEACLTMHA
ncbi:hypothetical protein MUK42_12390 [Musa troglodytarum]|uniref:Uncharacterized protein n=1 Tax=Musa troglodytarum TaxID=320322 RepID=A0A9E7GNR5_9LILI|nr:hypothetical protein MUK42_12390 [Musa troglodytarum]